MPPWNSAKAKVQLRLSVQRLRTLQQKKEVQAKATRRDIATLLERGKVETSKIKVESLINEEIYAELLELLELYCELLLARFGLLDVNAREPDQGISEGVAAIIYAAPRTELKELHVLRDILMHKYGREFSMATMDNRNNCVSERVVRKLATAPPSTELVEAYLAEIAKGYGVPWVSTPKAVSETDLEKGQAASAGVKDKDESEGISGVKSPPADELTPKLPDLPPTEDDAPTGQGTPTNPGGKGVSKVTPEPPEDEFEILAKRFAALKKR